MPGASAYWDDPYAELRARSPLQVGAEDIVDALQSGGAFGPGPLAIGMLRRAFISRFANPEVRKEVVQVIRKHKIPPKAFEGIEDVERLPQTKVYEALKKEMPGAHPSVGGYYDTGTKKVTIGYDIDPIRQAWLAMHEGPAGHALQERLVKQKEIPLAQAIKQQSKYFSEPAASEMASQMVPEMRPYYKYTLSPEDIQQVSDLTELLESMRPLKRVPKKGPK